MHTVYLGLGSNQGNRRTYLEAAIEALKEIGTVEAVSPFIETEPWGYDSALQYLNAAVRLCTELEPLALLDATQAIERRLGRTVKTGTDGIYHDRSIDIDILLYDEAEIRHPRLTIPHPLMLQRDFVMQPLRSILA